MSDDGLFTNNGSLESDGLHESNTSLKSIEDYEKSRNITQPVRCGVGVACPECSKELYDDSNGLVLLSNPPQRRVACVCGFTTNLTC